MISVIVPAFNVESTIIRTLDSILAQTYPEIVVIVVDDGSADETGKVIDNYASQHKRVTAIHTENQGVTAARLTGVAQASGEWIGFVDGDDEIEPDMYELLLKNAERYGADISHCGYQMIFADGRVSYFHNTGCLVHQDRTTGMKDLLDGTMVEPGLCNKLFRKTLFYSLLHTEVMDRSIKINEDLLMNYILFSNANMSVFQDICKYHYLIRSTSASRASLNQHKIFDPIRVKQLILDMKINGMTESAEKAYIGTCVNVYNSLVVDKSGQFLREQKSVRNLVKEHKTWLPLLSRKQQLLARLILYWPTGYKPMYRFYAKYLLKSCYE